jgi:amino acid transporter
VAAYSMQLAHPGGQFQDTDSAAFEVAKKIGGDVFVTVFLAGLILAQFASGISAQASVGRLLYAMGRDRHPAQTHFRLYPPALPDAGHQHCNRRRRRA